MPFLRLTRDRRGTENTFLMHADRPGDRPRLLYWYRTAPGIMLGRAPLDEDAIRTIEEQHPDIDFDWPAILALSEVMTPEDEAPARPQPREARESRDGRQGRRPKNRDREAEPDAARPQREPAGAREQTREPRRDEPVEPAAESGDLDVDVRDDVVAADGEAPIAAPPPSSRQSHHSSLVDQLAGREIASRLRGRYAEMEMRIRDADAPAREALMKRAEQIDPDRWDTPEAVLQGVSNADAIFEQLRAALAPPKS